MLDGRLGALHELPCRGGGADRRHGNHDGKYLQHDGAVLRCAGSAYDDTGHSIDRSFSYYEAGPAITFNVGKWY